MTEGGRSRGEAPGPVAPGPVRVAGPGSLLLPAPGSLLVANVGRPHGVRGELRLLPESDRPERLLGVTRLWLRASDGVFTEHAVVSVRVHAGAALVVLLGIDDRDVAASWTNREAWALKSELPAWAEDEFGLDEVVGSKLYDGDTLVGEITGVATNAGRDYFEVARDGRSVLVPAIKEWLIEMDRQGRRIVMRLPAGLVDET